MSVEILIGEDLIQAMSRSAQARAKGLAHMLVNFGPESITKAIKADMAEMLISHSIEAEPGQAVKIVFKVADVPVIELQIS